MEIKLTLNLLGNLAEYCLSLIRCEADEFLFNFEQLICNYIINIKNLFFKANITITRNFEGSFYLNKTINIEIIF